MPLASHEVATSAKQTRQRKPREIPLPAAPDFLMPADIAYQKADHSSRPYRTLADPAADLSLRNRLLNFPDSSGAVSFLCPDVAFWRTGLLTMPRSRLYRCPSKTL